jgi:hypothetical protein
LENYIGNEIRRTGKPFVLLIGEVARPIDEMRGRLLESEFLDNAQRMLLFTTHVPVELEGWRVIEPSAKPSDRAIEVVTSICPCLPI